MSNKDHQKTVKAKPMLNSKPQDLPVNQSEIVAIKSQQNPYLALIERVDNLSKSEKQDFINDAMAALDAI